MNKQCYKCKIYKAYSEFSKDIQKKDGLRSDCTLCRKKFRKPDSINTIRAYRNNNRNKIIDRRRRLYYQKERIRHSKYKSENKAKMAALQMKRYAAKLNATPKWLTSEHLKEIEMFYKVAAWLNGWKMMQFHVDHIIPLQGKEVSGLHVPWNLQILEASENIKKGNSVYTIDAKL